MNRFVTCAAVVPLLALGAAAQDPASDAKKIAEKKMLEMNMVGAIKGPLVKGMPYSADEITETTQILADGTRIHRENKVTVSRDSEGRTRRETPENVTISDPVAGATYVVNPKTNTVRKLQQSNTVYYRTKSDNTGATAGSEGKTTTFSLQTSGDGQASIEINGQPLDPKAVAELVAKAKAEGRVEVQGDKGLAMVIPDHEPVGGVFTMAAPPPGMQQFVKIRRPGNPGQTESLGTKNIEGVIADGTRTTETIETGAIGNDRPIQIVTETWVSQELGMMVYSKRSDPRTGEEIYRMTNIRRGDPPAYLFQPPADARSNERRM